MIKVITNLEAWAKILDHSYPKFYVHTLSYQEIRKRNLHNNGNSVIQREDGNIERFND